MKREEQISQEANKRWMQEGAHNKIWIDGARWADAHPNWISVEEELPKEDGVYLFCFDDGTYRVEGYFTELTLSKHVTHWMPLPTLPEKGGEK